jgi:hypothetical protein
MMRLEMEKTCATLDCFCFYWASFFRVATILPAQRPLRTNWTAHAQVAAEPISSAVPTNFATPASLEKKIAHAMPVLVNPISVAPRIIFASLALPELKTAHATPGVAAMVCVVMQPIFVKPVSMVMKVVRAQMRVAART